MKDYFSFSELTATDTGLYNSPPLISVALGNLRKLHFVLNILRHLVGCPIVVQSGYRSEAVNTAVGGVQNSKHLLGLAADISCSRSSVLRSILVKWKKVGILSELVIHDTYFHIAL